MQRKRLPGDVLTKFSRKVALLALVVLAASTIVAGLLLTCRKSNPSSAQVYRVERLEQELQQATQKEKELARKLDEAIKAAHRHDCEDAGTTVRVMRSAVGSTMPQWCECDCNRECKCY